jgi:hypothetical protein
MKPQESTTTKVLEQLGSSTEPEGFAPTGAPFTSLFSVLMQVGSDVIASYTAARKGEAIALTSEFSKTSYGAINR